MPPSDKTFPNISEEEQDMELEPVVMGPPAYGSPDPASALNTLLPVVDNPMVTVEETAEGEEAVAEMNYSEMSKEALAEEAEKRDLEVEGSGAGGNVVKDDLIEALEADDESNSDDS